MTTWAHASSKLGRIDPNIRKVTKEVFDAAQAKGHDVWFLWGMGPGEHGTGRAIDFMVRNKAAGDFIKAYIWKRKVRFRLDYVIWRQHIRSTTNSPGRDRFMADRGNSTNNHYDHNHVMFRSGTYRPAKGFQKLKEKITPVKKTPKKSNTTVAKEVIDGKWGNGPERIARLKRYGYNYKSVQRIVDRLVKSRAKKR